MTEADQYAEDLKNRGYAEAGEHNYLKVGQRVRHIGQQYPDAIQQGTGTLERIFVHTTKSRDIEVIVKHDEPQFGSDYGYWADYHTVIIRSH